MANKIKSFKLFQLSMESTPIIPGPWGPKYNCEFVVSLASITLSRPSISNKILACDHIA